MVIDGKLIASQILAEAKSSAEAFQAEHCRKPRLVVVHVGDDPASKVYVNNKVLACNKSGVDCTVYPFDETITTDELVRVLTSLSSSPIIDGIIVQMPLPAHVDVRTILSHIPPEKDVDGLTLHNQGLLFNGYEGLQPCTPLGVINMLEREGVPIEGANAVVIGRSILAGKPMALMLTNLNATVTLCHSKTKHIENYTRDADIVIVAVGIPGFLKSDMVKSDAVVIDVGITKVNERVVGDVADCVREKVRLYSPVPGGVGQTTVAMLVSNTVNAAIRRCAKEVEK